MREIHRHLRFELWGSDADPVVVIVVVVVVWYGWIECGLCREMTREGTAGQSQISYCVCM